MDEWIQGVLYLLFRRYPCHHRWVQFVFDEEKRKGRDVVGWYGDETRMDGWMGGMDGISKVWLEVVQLRSYPCRPRDERIPPLVGGERDEEATVGGDQEM